MQQQRARLGAPEEVLRKGGNEIVETGATAGGVPDSAYCFPRGRRGWLEFKTVRGWQVPLKPAQVSWIARRASQPQHRSVA